MNNYTKDIRNKITNLFKIQISPRPENLYLIPAYLVRDFPDSIFFTQDERCSLLPHPDSREIAMTNSLIKGFLNKKIYDLFQNSNIFFDLDGKRGEVTIRAETFEENEIYSIKQAIHFRIFEIDNCFYLALDPTVRLYNRVTLNDLIGIFDKTFFLQNSSCLAYITVADGTRVWQLCTIESFEGNGTIGSIRTVQRPFRHLSISTKRILPLLSKTHISKLLKARGLSINLTERLRSFSFQSGNNMSKKRLNRTIELLSKYIYPHFPMTIGNFKITINNMPEEITTFKEIAFIQEPECSFDTEDSSKKSSLVVASKKSSIKGGISEWGTEQKALEPIGVILLSTKDQMPLLEKFITTLNVGSSTIPGGMKSKFGAGVEVTHKYEVNRIEEYIEVCQEYIHNFNLLQNTKLAVVYMPEEEKYKEDSSTSFYYIIKAMLAEYGKPSQMVNINTLRDPKFKDINFALNIFDKAGYRPWSIYPYDEFKEVDMFIGLSYSSIKTEKGLRRNVGYVNVFDQFGRWHFIHAGNKFIDYENREKLIPDLIKDAILAYKSEGRTPKLIDLHYSRRYSREERNKTFKTVVNIIPDAEVRFIRITSNHPIRVYNPNNLHWHYSRGKGLRINDTGFVLCTTGTDQMIGTPVLLKANAEILPSDKELDIKKVAFRILALTKLNWKSVRPFCREPVTIRYAREIARLTSLLNLTKWNSINSSLRSIPWFL